MLSSSLKTVSFFVMTYLTLMTSGVASSANKENAGSESNRKTKTITSQEKKTNDNESDSEFHRRDKKFQLTFTLLGGGLGTIGGANAGYFLSPNQLFGIRWEKHEYLNVSYFSGVTKSYGIYGKTFFGNSFYVNYGLSKNYSEFRLKKARYSLRDLLTNNVSRDLTYIRNEKWEHSGIDLSIGNQWQWEHFTLGADWVGFYQSFASSRKEYYENERDQENHDALFLRDHIRGLVFYIGSSF